MIIVLKSSTSEAEIARISRALHERWGGIPEKIIGRHRTVIAMVGDTNTLDPRQIQNISPWIEQVLPVERPFKRVSREFRHGEASDVIVSTPNGSITFGEYHPIVLVAGPCSVESEEMIVETARRVKAAGASFL
jgi:3-deoxy-7-phosphoheptulonate synthase